MRRDSLDRRRCGLSEFPNIIVFQRPLNVTHFEGNSATLLHTGDDKKACKGTDDIRCTVVVFDATFVREDIL